MGPSLEKKPNEKNSGNCRQNMFKIHKLQCRHEIKCNILLSQHDILCFTFMSRFLPKLNFTRKKNINPAKTSLKMLEIPPTPTYAPYWTCKKHTQNVSTSKTIIIIIYGNACHFTVMQVILIVFSKGRCQISFDFDVNEYDTVKSIFN